MPLSPRATEHIEGAWDTIVPALEEYISIPNVSVAFDPDWAAHGHMQRAVELVRDWCVSREIDGANVEVHELAGRTPLIVVEVPAFGGAPEDETERYRQAAEDALQQLDWCIGYLHGIRKVEISRALAKNRSFIRRRLLDRPEEPDPSAKTDET